MSYAAGKLCRCRAHNRLYVPINPSYVFPNLLQTLSCGEQLLMDFVLFISFLGMNSASVPVAATSRRLDGGGGGVVVGGQSNSSAQANNGSAVSAAAIVAYREQDALQQQILQVSGDSRLCV